MTRARITGLALGALTIVAIASGAVLAGGDGGGQLQGSRGADDLIAAAAQPAPSTTTATSPADAGAKADRKAATDADARPSKAERGERDARGDAAASTEQAAGSAATTPEPATKRSPAPAPKPKPQPSGLRLDGPRLPNVSAKSTDGNVDFGALRGPAVIHVYASWCPTCRAEAPGFGRALERAPGVRPIYLAVADEPADAAAFVRRHSWPNGPRIDDPERELANKLGVDYQPNLILVDRAGRTRVLAGGLAEAKLTAVLQALEA